MCLVDIVQHMWQTRDIPHEFGWTILFLIPKGTTDTWGIGLLETLCKVVKVLIYTGRRSSLQFYNSLHGFRYGIGTGAAIMKLKLS